MIDSVWHKLLEMPFSEDKQFVKTLQEKKHYVNDSCYKCWKETLFWPDLINLSEKI